MKKSLLFFTTFLLSFSYSCEKKVDVESEKVAIKAVIQQEVDAFMAKDMTKLESLYVQDEINTRLQETCSKEHPVYTGWTNVKSFLENMMKESDGKNTNIKNSKENFIINIKGDCAWVINKDVWSGEIEGKSYGSYGIQTTFMEKINGSWKISMMSCYYRDHLASAQTDTLSVKK